MRLTSRKVVDPDRSQACSHVGCLSLHMGFAWRGHGRFVHEALDPFGSLEGFGGFGLPLALQVVRISTGSTQMKERFGSLDVQSERLIIVSRKLGFGSL